MTLDEITPIEQNSTVENNYRHRVVRHSILWLFGQATAESVSVGGEPTAMLPGMCSNPEPTDLSDMPLGSIDYARYLLAQAETALAVAAGVEAGLRGKLGGRAIPNMELLLRGTRMEFCVRRFDAVAMIANLPSWVDSQIYLDRHRDVVRQSGPGNPAYGEIDAATAEQLLSGRAIFSAEDALLTFGLMAAFERKPEALASLCALATSIKAGYPGAAILGSMASGNGGDSELSPIVAVYIHRLINRADLVPDDLFMAGLRFLEAAKRSNFSRILAPALENWARERWAYAIEEQRFHLRNPVASVPSIREVLASRTTGLTFLGRLHVAVEPAVKINIPQVFREMLLGL